MSATSSPELGDARVETLCAIARHYAAGRIEERAPRAVEASLAAAHSALASHDSDASLRYLEAARTFAARSGIALDSTYQVAVG